MKIFYLLGIVALTALPCFCQVAAPVEVVNSAIAAMNDYGSQLVQGKFHTLYDRMNPQWRAKLAEKSGGEENLRKQCESTGAVLAKNATTMILCNSTGFPTVFEVSPGKEETVVNAKKEEKLIYKKWLLLIPTITHFRIIGQDGNHTVEVRSFQVVISDKSKLQWSFIDGATTSVAELRNLFISLPVNVTLPKQEKKLLDTK